MTIIPNSPEWGEDTYWESKARTRWGNYISEVEKRVILQAQNLTGFPTTALEVGAEGGRWSKLLIDLGWNMICSDVNPKTLAICKRRIPTANCILVSKDDTTLPGEAGSVGLILCIEVISVLRTDWFIIESFRVLQDGGLVVGVFENKLSLRGYLHHLVSSITGRFDYYAVAYPNWRSKFQKQGFKLIYEEGICWFPFTRGSNSPLVPLFTQAERYLGLRCLPSVSPWIVFLAQKEFSA